MTTALAQVRQSSNYATDLSTEQKRQIKFFASAHMTADEIAARAWASVEQVKAYCHAVRINVK